MNLAYIGPGTGVPTLVSSPSLPLFVAVCAFPWLLVAATALAVASVRITRRARPLSIEVAVVSLGSAAASLGLGALAGIATLVAELRWWDSYPEDFAASGATTVALLFGSFATSASAYGLMRLRGPSPTGPLPRLRPRAIATVFALGAITAAVAVAVLVVESGYAALLLSLSLAAAWNAGLAALPIPEDADRDDSAGASRGPLAREPGRAVVLGAATQIGLGVILAWCAITWESGIPFPAISAFAALWIGAVATLAIVPRCGAGAR